MKNKSLDLVSKKIRYYVLNETVKKQRGHLGGTFSCVELLVCLYYSKIFKFDSKNLKNKKNDKGHACSALYWILYDKGFISKKTFDSYALDQGLGAQLDININGVDWNTGSLGHSIGVATGVALGNKLSQNKKKSITLIGDAECAEGSIWESLIFAGERKVSDLIVIVDRNRLSVTEELSDDSFFSILPKTLNSLGWKYIDINGHNIDEIITALKTANNSKKPSFILANTIKGKGVSFMENKKDWHHSLPSNIEIHLALNELKN
ncbi:thiamine pyrophosphate-dependent enzyme [Pelagibacteraceae bacterium]|nr:thiamine pyrophosphate-dependent enzyme [Pelagibacteraceae bacterium]